nr:hypothetical protein [Tanacetum cinerariifolium]
MANFPLAYNYNHIDNVANVRYFILYYKEGFSSNAENIPDPSNDSDYVSGDSSSEEDFAEPSPRKITLSTSMDSLSPQVVSAAKLPILNPNEFDLWKMRIEQYFLMTDYSLWEVILNGDSPVLTQVVEGIVQPVAPTTAEQRLARKNELKARGDDSVERAITTDASLVAAHDSDNITKTKTMAMHNVDIPQGMDTGGSPRRQETIGGTPAQSRSERVLEKPNEPPLGEGNTSQSGEASMQYLELMEICTKLLEKVTSLENELTSTKVVYNKALITLTKRVKKLEKQLKHKGRRAIINSSDDAEPSLDAEDSPKQGKMIEEIDKDENVNLVSEQGEAQEAAEHRMEFSTASLQTADDETLAETLLNIKRSTTKDNEKGTMQETKLPKKIKKRELIQLSLDEELAQKLHAEELAKETARQEQEKYNIEKALELQKTVRSKGGRCR